MNADATTSTTDTTSSTDATTTAPVSVVGVRLVPKGGGYGVPHAPAVYTPHLTKDGRWVWRCTERCLLGTVWGRNGSTRERGVYSLGKAERLAAEIAESRGLPEWSAAHNRPLTAKEVERFVLGLGA